MDAINTALREFDKVIAHLRDEFSRLQVGRANPALIENVGVELYGVSQPIKAVGSISVPDPRTIMIQPWDKSALAAIERGISAVGLGLNPVNDGICVRISIPPLTEERRTELTKVVKRLAEEAKVAIRAARQDAHTIFKNLKADSTITEDDWHSADKQLQAKVDGYNEQIDKLAEIKEKDIMTV